MRTLSLRMPFRSAPEHGRIDEEAKALLCEISEEWLTGKIYLNMKPADLPQK
jgi:hypothetical protein